jgi:polysaccharide biosynthesis transport protein
MAQRTVPPEALLPRRSAADSAPAAAVAIPQSGGPTRPSSTNFAGLWRILAGRWKSITAITLTSLGLAIFYLLVTPPTYSASTTLFIDPRPKKIVSEDTSQGGLGTDLALLESQVAIIRSDAVLSRVVGALKLDEDPEFAPRPAEGLSARIKSRLGMARPAAEPSALALANLAQRVAVKRAQKTYVVEIEATSASPVKAARITQSIVDAYLADQTSAKTDEAQRANALIDSRLGELREQVRRAETRVDEFRKANRILTSEGGTVGEQQLTRLNSELINARTQAAEAKARLDEVSAAAKTGNPDVITDPTKTALVQRLREQLAQVARREASLASQLMPRHPVLIDIRSQVAALNAQISAELRRLASNAKADFQVATSRERELIKALDTAKAEVGRTNTAQIKQRELEQEVAASRELMRVFLARSKETDEQQKISAPDARMISPPSVPGRPTKPVPALILALGLLGGLAAGVARALTLDHFDTRLRSPEDIDARTGLRTLAEFPLFKPRGVNVTGAPASAPFRPIDLSRFGLLVRAIGNSGARDETAYRQATLALLSRIRSRAGGYTPYSVLVVTPHAGCGGSSVALSIATAAGLLGDRVLLVDAASADTAIAGAYGAPVPGDRAVVLDDKSDLASILTRDSVTGVAILPIGLADLRRLKSTQQTRLQRGLSALARDFDLVVIDGGAVLEDDSANVMLPCANEILVVARAGLTDAAALDAVARHFEPALDRLSGVVLTKSSQAGG